jgi:predicted transcriptional regulator
MTTLTIGILPIEQMKARTLAIACGELNVLPDDPKNWLPSTGTLGKILSGPNRALLAEISRDKPQSISELAERTGRKLSHLSRTLKSMERYGLVVLRKAADGRLAPEVGYDDLTVKVPILGALSAA